MQNDKHSLKELVVKLNDRNIQRQRESGLTLYAILAVAIYISIYLLDEFSIFFDKEIIVENIFILSIVGNSAFVAGYLIMWLFIVVSVKVTKVYPNSSFGDLDNSDIPMILFFGLFTIVNLIAAIYSYNCLLAWLYSVFTLLYFLNFITPFIISLVKWRRARKKLAIVPEFTYLKSTHRERARRFVLLYMVVFLIPLLLLIFNQEMTMSKLEITSGVKYSILIIGFLLAIQKIFSLKETANYNDGLEELEKDIYLHNLSDEEIKKRLELEYFGQDFMTWAKYREQDITTYMNKLKQELESIKNLIPMLNDQKIDIKERQPIYDESFAKRQELINEFETYALTFNRQIKHLNSFSSIDKEEYKYFEGLKKHYKKALDEVSVVDKILFNFFSEIQKRPRNI